MWRWGTLTSIMTARLTNEEIDNRVATRNIVRLDDYINMHTKIRWECSICGSVWSAQPRSLLNCKKSGCANCAGNKKGTTEQYSLELKNRNILVIGEYINSKSKILHSCTTCEATWEATPDDIKNGKTGCPDCSKILAAKTRIKPHSKYTAELLGTSITVLDRYVDAKTNINHECDTCGNTWLVRPDNILSSKTGCPVCANVVRAISYVGAKGSLLKIKALKIPYYIYTMKSKKCIKVGISCNVAKRLKSINQEIKDNNYKFITLKTYCTNAWEAVMLETKVLNKFKIYKSPIKFGGYTELRKLEDLQDIITFIEGELKND